MREVGAIEVGALAPEFTLKDQGNRPVSLSSLRGKKVILSFHPLAWTSVCTTQMQDLEKHRGEWAQAGAVALGLSVDSQPCKKAWAEAIGVHETSILADFWPHGGVIRSYGIFREKDGFSERAVFILDEQGVVRWQKVYPLAQVPDIDEIVRVVTEL